MRYVPFEILRNCSKDTRKLTFVAVIVTVIYLEASVCKGARHRQRAVCEILINFLVLSVLYIFIQFGRISKNY